MVFPAPEIIYQLEKNYILYQRLVQFFLDLINRIDFDYSTKQLQLIMLDTERMFVYNFD